MSPQIRSGNFEHDSDRSASSQAGRTAPESRSIVLRDRLFHRGDADRRKEEAGLAAVVHRAEDGGQYGAPAGIDRHRADPADGESGGEEVLDGSFGQGPDLGRNLGGDHGLEYARERAHGGEPAA